MIRDDRATLSIYSDSWSVARITEKIGLAPTEAADIGDPTRAGLAGLDLKPKYLTHQRTHWSLDVDQDLADQEDETGFASVTLLMRTIASASAAIAELKPDCDVIVWWSGFSDSSQGGFVIPSTLLADLARTGADLYGTAYLDDDETPEAQ